MTNISVIGAGISGLAAAACLSAKGAKVTVFDKLSHPGGRARVLEAAGYRFDMGPTWYWMPDVFERFFAQFGRRVDEYYKLIRLDPGYKIYFSPSDAIEVPANMEQLIALFDATEPGSGRVLAHFLKQAKRRYDVGINRLVYKPALNPAEYLDVELLRHLWDLRLFRSLESELRSRFRNPRLLQLLSFPVIFLGATARDIPAFYSLMNYADLQLGTWYPQHGMADVTNALVSLNEQLGTQFVFNTEVRKIKTNGSRVSGIETDAGFVVSDYVLSSADYAHTDLQLLGHGQGNYTQAYWDKRKMAPSALLFYLGYKQRARGIAHHNLLFDTDFDHHSANIYQHPAWPTEPALYISAASLTDPDCAPPGHENIIVLIPTAPGLAEEADTRDYYLNYVLKKLDTYAGLSPSELDYKAIYGYRNFVADYHSFKGNAYGLANVLSQTAFLKPKLVHRQLKNLVYCGQLTVPGPGVPPALISGTLAADYIGKRIKNK